MEAVHAVLMLDTKQTKKHWNIISLPRITAVCWLRVSTCGRPVRMVERLGEQLLTEVKALSNTRLRWARERRFGVRTTELLYTSVSKPASSAGRGTTSLWVPELCSDQPNNKTQNIMLRCETLPWNLGSLGVLFYFLTDTKRLQKFPDGDQVHAACLVECDKVTWGRWEQQQKSDKTLRNSEIAAYAPHVQIGWSVSSLQTESFLTPLGCCCYKLVTLLL